MDTRDLTFLVVEDHDFQRDMVVRMLQELGAKAVHSAADGRAALDLLKNLHGGVDIVVADLDMPTMDGIELIRNLGTNGSATSLIVTSALDRVLLSSVETMAHAYGIEVLDTIEKPVTQHKLEDVISRYQAKPRRSRAAASAAFAFEPDEITDAIDHDEFEPYFQPKIDLATSKVVGAEALARWRHPQHGIVPPAAFVDALERSGRIDMLMRCMLRKSAAACRDFAERGHEGTVSVNVSLRSLDDVTLSDQIVEIVRSQSLEPRFMVLELTESAATTELARALDNLTRLRMKGFGIGIDDYGTGYSSLVQLTRVPFTELKIDQSFVVNAGRRESARVILESSLDMARKLGMHTVAEGVETRENWDMLLELGCEVAQGYYIARPMPVSAYLKWLATWQQMSGH